MKRDHEDEKSRKKQVHNLENDKLNNVDEIRALKDDLNRLKSEKTKFEKQFIKKEKKATKSKNVPEDPDQAFPTSHAENPNHTNPLSNDLDQAHQ